MIEPTVIWREDSAIGEIVAGELVVQHGDPIAEDPETLIRHAGEHIADAAQLLRQDNRDDCGHALIGCALALGLAAIARSDEPTPIGSYGSELAAEISWQATEPKVEDLERLQAAIAELSASDAEEQPTRWELAVRTGSFAAGLSPYISRRRQRRDLA